MMPGMPDLTQIVLKAQQMQAEMERAQASLAQAEVTGAASGGLVTAVVSGSGDLLRIRIDQSVVDPSDVETLEDLVVAAVHDARRAAEDMASAAMGSVAGGLAGSLDLSSMGLGGFPGLPGFGGGQQALEDDFDDIADEDDDDDDDDDDDEEEGIIGGEAIVVDGTAEPTAAQPSAPEPSGPKPGEV